jgi:hypothetical protein
VKCDRAAIVRKDEDFDMKRRTRRLLRKLRNLPLKLRATTLVVALVAALALANWIYQAARKPSEILFPVSGVLFKTPAGTWREYGDLFREHSTAVMAPDLLAALAQVEGGGNPLARTYWRWRLAWNPFEVYQPASSAVGMFQITDGRFAEARRYCIHDHRSVERECWFNGLYNRLVPSHAVELTAAFLDRSVGHTLARARVPGATLRQKQDLAAVIHLCGAGAGEAYARRGFRAAAGQRCGDHPLAAYLSQVNATRRQFARLAASTT